MRLPSLTEKSASFSPQRDSNGHDRAGAAGGRDIASESVFGRLLGLERKRAERSGRQFLLVLLEAQGLFKGNEGESLRNRVVDAVLCSTRETDLSGWHRHHATLGVILTDIDRTNLMATINAVVVKLNAALLARLPLHEVNKIHFSFHPFPEDGHPYASTPAGADLKLYPDLTQQSISRKVTRLIKRTIDVAGSVALLTFLSPLMSVIALAVKLDSKGPALFRQERLGQYGVPFTFLKFRTMYFRADSKIHEDYVKRFISGDAEQHPAGDGASRVYKLTRDPRITRIGRFLRKTSLDELPQFLNVLRGEMSLVGPRPALRYEFVSYNSWHRRRLFEVRPGITGLWQVNGRSRTKFDEMVRLDLRYAQTWSLLLDLKILLKTPRAIVLGEGA